MRRASRLLIALAVAALAAPTAALAQSREQEIQQQISDQAWQQTPNLRLSNRANAGPCPFVKILYDAARYVEFQTEQPSAAGVSYTGEIEGVASDCSYREDDPISVRMDILFHLGRGPQAESAQRSYRYWIAVTDRNAAVLAKEYFDLAVDFGDQDRAYVTEEIRNLVIPRAAATVSGGNFEILVGFEVTPEMAAFNRSGSRFRIDAGAAGQP